MDACIVCNEPTKEGKRIKYEVPEPGNDLYECFACLKKQHDEAPSKGMTIISVTASR